MDNDVVIDMIDLSYERLSSFFTDFYRPLFFKQRAIQPSATCDIILDA